jgi:hypothetical protein
MDWKNTSSSYARALDMENFNWTLTGFENESVENVNVEMEACSYTPTNLTALISGNIRLVVY